MSPFVLWRRIRWWLDRRTREADLAEEVAFHEAETRRRLEASGLSPAEARLAGRRAMGNTVFMREEARAVWIWPWLDRLSQDVRYALRSIRTNPTFAFGVVGITALGIGATTTIFSVVDGVVLRRLPYPAADRLVAFDQGSHTPPRFRDWQRTITSVERWSAAWPSEEDLVGDGHPERLNVVRVSSDFLAVFGNQPVLGRQFTSGDYAGAGDVAMLSSALWRRRFGGDSAVLGRTLELGGRRVVVIGVAAPGLPEADLVARGRMDLMLPLVYPPDIANNPDYMILSVVGRLKPGISIEAARRELATLAPRLARENPKVHADESGVPLPILILPLRKAMVREVDRPLATLLGAVGLMLLIACANVTNLYLARSTDRSRELAVRAAIGAGRGRLARQLVTESLTLGVVAGGLGAALAVIGVKVLTSLYPGDLPRIAEVSVDGRVLAFAIVVAGVTGIVFGLVPASLLRDERAYEAIRGSALAAGGRRGGRLRAGLIVAELALALVLLVGSGLLFHSLLEIVRVDPGFDPSGLTMARLQLGPPFTPERRLAFAEGVADRIRAIPGVTGVAFGVVGPMARTGASRCCWGDHEAKAENGTVTTGRIMIHPVGPNYFRVLRARLGGPDFGSGEVFAEPYPAILSNHLATRLFGAADPIGKRVTVGTQSFVVRGVVSGLHQWGLDQPSELEVFVPYHAFGARFDWLNLVVQSGVEPAALVGPIRQAIWALEPGIPADDVQPVAALVRHSFAGPRFYSALMGAFAGLALLLAAVGLYASMLYSVRQRSRELGIRAALGADGGDITRMVVGDAGRLALGGLALGSLGAAALARTLGGFLFGIGPADPVTFGAAALLLAVAILAAAYFPARRAGRADPLTVLRAE
jgi:predicted permease